MYKDKKDPRAREARRKHYHQNKDAYTARKLQVEAELRGFVLEIKNTTPCFDCKVLYVGEPWLTEFDHVRGEKRFSISRAIKNGSMKTLLEEIEKCDLVCLVCHRRRTAKRGGWLDNRLAHLLN